MTSHASLTPSRKLALAAAPIVSVFLTGSAMAATGSSSGIGAQFQSTAQEGMDAAGAGSSAVLYSIAFIAFISALVLFYKNSKEETKRPGLVMGALVCILVAGGAVAAPSLINKASNSASGGNAQIGTQAKSYQFQ